MQKDWRASFHNFLQFVENVERVLWGIMSIFPWLLILALLAQHTFFGGIPPLVDQTNHQLIITVLIIIALSYIWIAFTIHAISNPDFSASVKLQWVLLIFFGNIFVYPAYWWYHIKDINSQQRIYESSFRLTRDMISPALTRLSGVFDSGFDIAKINELYDITVSVEPGAQRETVFEVTQDGGNEVLIYRVFADDIDSFSVYIYASKKLVEKIDTQMQSLSAGLKV